MSQSTAVATATSSALVPFAEMERMAITVAKSNLFGVKTADQALALMVIAQAQGRHPGTVASEYHIIEGRPSLKADTMLERYIAAGGSVKWTSYTTKKVAAVFTHATTGSIEIEWTIEMAQSAGLTKKDNWAKYPRAMLRARVISEGVRTSYPGVAAGIYTPEEVQDFLPAEPTDVTPGAEQQPGEVIEGELIQRGKSATDAPQPTTTTAAKVNDSQLKFLRKKVDASGIPESDILDHFQIASFEDLEFDRLNACLDWIKKNSP